MRRLDSIEQSMRSKHQPDQNVITPPETDYDLRIRRGSMDIEHPNALDPEETNATEAPANNLAYRLHKAAGVPFLFPSYLRQGLSHPGVPFPIVPCTVLELPFATPRDIDRCYFHFHTRSLTGDYWIITLRKYIFGSLSWSLRIFDISL